MGVREQCVKKYGRGIYGSYYLRKSKVIILKIDIVGSVASGKTTLARKISKEFNIPHYEKDNVVWKRTPSGDVKRTPQERDAYFNDIISKKEWVVEGSPRQSLKESYDCCDYIIVLDEYTLTRLIRVFEFNKIKKNLLCELENYGKKVKKFRHSKDAYGFLVESRI